MNFVAETPARSTRSALTCAARDGQAAERAPSGRRAADRRRASRRAPCRRRSRRSSRSREPGSQLPHLLEAPVPHVAQNDVIHHVDPHQHPRRGQPPRQLHIVRAWGGIAGGMIVKHHDRRRAADAPPLETPRAARTIGAVQRCRPPAPPSASPDASCRAARCRTVRPRATPNARHQVRRRLAAACASGTARSGACASVRRPSSSAATICAARARPMPAIRDEIVSGAARQAVQPAVGGQQGVGDAQRVAAPRAAAEHQRDELVVAERRRPMMVAASRAAGRRATGLSSYT